MFSLIGNTQIQRLLENMLEKNQIPPTLLFEGPKGVGKGQFAKVFAEKLLGGCVRADLRHFYPEGKAALHPMEAMKEFIADTALPPFEADRRVFIIHDADRMLPPSANALLKTLEEPALHNVILLTSSHYTALLPTIISRCMTLSFSPLQEEEVSEYLVQTKKIPIEDARTLARLARGSLTRADLLVEEQYRKMTQCIATIGQAVIEQNSLVLSQAITDLEQMIKQESKAPEANHYEDILHTLLYWFRDLHLMRLDPSSPHLFFKEHREALSACLKHPIPPLDFIQKRIERAREALELNIPFQSAFLTLF